MGKYFQKIGPEKQGSVPILISNKLDFKPKLIKREGDGYLILIKENQQQTFPNIYTPKQGHPDL